MLQTILTVALITSVSAPNAPRLVDVAFRAGHDASVRVFHTQEASEVERRCQAEADRERQVCLQEGRTQCDELYETRFATCLAAPPSDADTGRSEGRSRLGTTFMWIGIGFVGLLGIALIAAASGDDQSDYNY